MKPITITEAPLGCLMRIGEYEPGNGMNYKAIAVKFPFHSNFNALGRISTGWLVVNCNTGLAYLFQEKGFLVDDSIQEKLGGLNADYPYFGDLVRKLIFREFKEGKKK